MKVLCLVLGGEAKGWSREGDCAPWLGPAVRLGILTYRGLTAAFLRPTTSFLMVFIRTFSTK